MIHIHADNFSFIVLQNCRKHMYKSRDAFWEYINLIVTNCITYNGEGVCWLG